MKKPNLDKKPRDEIIEFYIDDIESELEFEYDFIKDSIKIKNAIVSNTKIQTSYKKNSGKTKLTNSTPMQSSELQFNCDKAIFENYDVIIAIDTNTKLIHNELLSVTSSYFINRPMSECNKIGEYPFIAFAAHLFIGIQDDINPEKLGWHTIISKYIESRFPSNYRIGIIVDCDLGVHDSINISQTCYFEDFKLPKNMQFIYASSDKKSDSIANQMISYSDKLASQILNSKELDRILTSNNTMNDLKYCKKHTPIRSQNRVS